MSNMNATYHGHARPSREQIQAEALQRATCGTSLMNYGPIFEGFAAKGIPESEILPRENVLTFNAWKALGHSVKKGEHGVKVLTWITAKGEKADANEEEGRANGYRFCRSTTVFHISQTEAR